MTTGIKKRFYLTAFSSYDDDGAWRTIISKIIPRIGEFIFAANETPAFAENRFYFALVKKRVCVAPRRQGARLKQRFSNLAVMSGIKEVCRRHDAIWKRYGCHEVNGFKDRYEPVPSRLL